MPMVQYGDDAFEELLERVDCLDNECSELKAKNAELETRLSSLVSSMNEMRTNYDLV